MKRFVSILLSICILLGAMPQICFAAAKSVDPNTAFAVLGDNVQSHNFKSVESGTNKEPDIGEKGGNKCWILSNRLGGDLLSYINFDIDDNYSHNQNSGDVYEIEIDYYDQDKGYFYLEYDSHYKPMKQAEITYLKNENMWKTAKYVLDDAFFGGRVDGGFDFRIVIKPWQSTVSISPGPVAIKEVRVKKIPDVHKIKTYASTDESGNSFEWFNKEKIVHNTLENVTDMSIEAEVTFSAIGTGGYKGFEVTKKMSFAPHEKKELDINIETDRCDLYDWIVSIKSKKPEMDIKSQRIQFAILKTDPNGIKNEHAYLSNHLERYNKDYPSAIDEGMDLIRKSNVIGIRGNGSWSHMEVSRGVYAWEGLAETIVAEKAREMGMEVLWQLNAGHNDLTKLWSNLIQTEDEYEMYGNFLEFFVDKVKDYTTDYEIANELDLPQYNTRGLSTEELTRMIHFATDIIKRKDPNARVHAWGFTGIKGANNWEMLNEAIELGALDDLDFISYHPYNNTEVVEVNGLSEAAQRYLDRVREVNPDAGLSITEVGNSITDSEVSYDEHNLGSNMTRMGVHFLSREVAEILVYYNFARKGIANRSAREDGFGMVRVPMTRASDDSGKAMTPYESYVSFTAMNYVMAQTTPDKVYDLDSNIKISSFDSKKFNGKVLSMNTVFTPEVISLKLDCDSVRLFDDYGNEKLVYGDEGVFTFSLDDRLLYAVGDFTSVEEADETVIGVKDAVIGAVLGDVLTISATGDKTKSYKLDIDVPVNCDVISVSDVENGAGNARVHLKEKRGEYMFVDVTLTDKATGKVMFGGQVKITMPVPITSELSIELLTDDNVDKWKGIFDVTNNSQSKAVQGYIMIKSPEVFASIKHIDVGIIPPGKTAQLNVDLPPLYRKGIYNVEYDVVTNEFDTRNFLAVKDLTVATGSNGKIKIDGKIEDDEWVKNSFMYADTMEQIGNITDWKGVSDLSFKAAVAYDEEHMYLCADVTDDIFYQDQQGKTTWQGDSIQVGVFYGEEGHTALGDRSTTFHELCIALTPNGPEIFRHLSQDNVYPSAPFEGADVSIVREGKKTLYEVKIPWKDLLLEGQQPQKGDRLGFAMLANDNDGGGRRGWIHYAGGIAPAKTTKLFTYLLLTK